MFRKFGNNGFEVTQQDDGTFYVEQYEYFHETRTDPGFWDVTRTFNILAKDEEDALRLVYGLLQENIYFGEASEGSI